MKILSKMMLTLVAFALVSTSVFAQTQKSVKDPNAPSVPKATEVGRALGDDCSNPYVVDINALPFSYTDTQASGTCGHGNNYSDNPDLGYYDNGEDVVYRLQPNQDVELTAVLDGAESWFWIGYYHSISVFKGCPSGNSLVAFAKANGSDQVIDLQCMLQANTEYFVLVDYWGDAWDPCLSSYTLSLNARETAPRLEATANPINLGDWPINAWQESSVAAEFTNTGSATAKITAIDLEDFDNAFQVVDPVNLSYSLGIGETATLSKLKGRATTPGVHSGQYIVSYGTDRAVATADITMNAYMPVVGDVWENPIVATLPYSAVGASTVAPMHKNYLPGVAHAGKDVIYKFTLASDQEVDVNISNATDNFGLAIYAAGFDGQPGPMSDNYIVVKQDANITDLPLFAGDYYLGVAGTNAASDISYDIDIIASDMPAPLKPINPDPAHLATDVNANGTVATWDFPGDFTKQYRVYFGNVLPLTEALSWTDVEGNSGSFALPDMDPNLQYFWRVDVRNDHHEVEGDVWAFTTQLTAPTNLIAQVTGSPANDVNLSWELDAPRIFRYFNVYRDGVEIVSNLTETSYQDKDVAHGCYEYQVEAVYDEGTSAKSDVAEACIYGNGTHHGTVKDAFTGVVIPNVTITYEGVEGTVAEDYNYTVTTDENGYYEVEAHEGLYDITIEADGYVSQNSQDVLVVYNVDETRNYFLTEETNPVTAEIRATEVGDNVEIVWEDRSGDRSLKGYNVYRVQCYDESVFEFLGYTVDKRFTDHNWGDVSYGTYKWGIEAVYDAGVAERAYSNCLDKDMLTTVNVTVTTNSGDSPAGTHVTFTNISEPAMNLAYDLILDDTGMATISDFRKGTYNIAVEKAGFEPITVAGDVIEEEKNYTWELTELNDAPINLWVSPLGYAQWDLPFGDGAGDGTMIDVDFEDGAIPADWSVEDLGSTAGVDLWYVTDSYTKYGTTYQLNGTYFAFVNSDAAGSGTTVHAALVSPEVNNATAANVTLEFEQFFRPYGGFGDVDVWDGSAWQTVLHQTAQAGDWSNADMQSIDVTAYRNANFKVRFNYRGSYAYYWALDNVKVFDNTRGATAAADRAPLHYQVWLDGIFAGNTEETHYQHDVTPLTLGQSYTTEVAIVYTTGMSGKASYTWTYLDCDHFQHPVTATTEYDPQFSPEYVTVSWTNNAPVAGADFLGVNLYRDGNMIAFVEAPATSYADSTNTGLEPGNSYEYCLRAVYTNDGGNHTWMSCEGTTCTTFDMPEILPAPINLTAMVVDTVNVELNWELPESSNDYTFQSFTVYKDGVVLATGLTTTTYTNINLPLGCYTYEVEAIYAEGISPKSLPAEACIIGTATVKGTVTDVTTGLPIEGATVALDGDVDYTFTTDADGMYEAEVWEGEYNYTVSAEAYQTQTLTAVTVALNTVEVRDFALDDEYQSVDEIVAEELSNDKVEVRWGGESSPNPAGGLTESFDTGEMPEGWTTIDADGDGFTWDPSFLFDFTPAQGHDGSIGMISSASYINNVGAVNPDNYLVTPMLSLANGGTLTFWVRAQDGAYASEHYAVYASTTGNQVADFSDAPLLEETMTAKGERYAGPRGSRAAGTWYQKTVELPAGTKYVAFRHFNCTDNYWLNLDDVEITSASKSRELKGYNVYRVACFDETQSQFLGYTLDSVFTDNNWGDVAWGNYKWGVERVYTNGVSEMAYSNCLDKDMLTSVSVTVTTNSGDSPAGATVTLTNISEPELNWNHVFVLDDTGMATCDTIRKGVYNIEVTKEGFEALSESDIVIESPQQFEWMLTELFLAPLNLWVSPTGYATWKSPINDNPNPNDGINADFNDGMPAGWEVVDNGSTPGKTLWEVVDEFNGSTLDGTPFAFINSDAAGSGTVLDAYLVSPVIDNSADANVTLQFIQNYQHITGFGFSAVEVWNGSEWVEVLHQEEDLPTGNWMDDPNAQTLDLTAHKNANFQVRFHYYATWSWYWALDNVQVFSNAKTAVADRAERGVQGYKVWLDNVYEADTDTTWYQHDVTNLTEGESYTTEVATVFATGISEKASYTWTYVPCDQYEAPKGIFAEAVEGTENANVYWSDVVGNLSTVNISQGYGDPVSGWYQKYNSGYGVVYDLSAYPDAQINMTKYHHTSWGVVGTWEYKVHIVDWDTKTIISTAGPFQTTGDDQWEDNIALGDVSTGGATEVAILVEPMSNNPEDAYPCLSADGDVNAMGSVFVQDLSDIAGTYAGNNSGAQPVGRFLMEMTILTSNAKGGTAVVKPMTISGNAVSLQARVSSKSLASVEPMIKQEGNVRDVERIGANLYRDGEFLAFVPAPDTSYVDEGLEKGTEYRYCVAYVYTNDGGNHTWTSCLNTVCTTFIMPEACLPPKNLEVTDVSGDGKKITLDWELTQPISFDPTWLDLGITTSSGTLAYSDAEDGGFVMAHRYPVGTMDAYEGGAITKVKAYIGDAPSSATIKIWQGAGAANLIYEQEVTSDITANAWNEFTLTTPVVYDITQDLMVGVDLFLLAGQSSAGYVEPAAGSEADWLYMDAAGWIQLGPSFGWDISWCLGFYVDGAKGATEPMPVLVNSSSYTNQAAPNFTTTPLAVPAVDPFTNAAAQAERGLLGYNVYRDGEKVNSELVTETTYVEMNLPGNHTYCWKVSAVYEFCGESDFSDEVCKEIYEGVDEYDNTINIYPNPAKDYVKIDANSTIDRVLITNMAGQVVRNIEAVSATHTTIDTQAFGAGVYFVEVSTANGAQKVKLVVTK